MDPTTSGHVLRPLGEAILTLFPMPFYLQFVQLLAAALNGLLGIFGVPPAFVAL